ncbi:hypothetical protein ACQP2T_63465 (plasmid) [Nonomuraea sp. CA-143628]|uniref:hypothetical protein n=1 Tax=Nonomuraea sp. CA-143628 TaxID=3239997 RepID=UPI003D9295D6
MATVPNPRTWTSSEQVTAAKLNTDIRDSWNFFKARPFCLLGKTADTSITISTLTAIPWDVELKDSDNGHSNVTNNTRYTAQTAGWYSVRCIAYLIRFDFSWADLTIRKNGATQQSRSTLIPTKGSGDFTVMATAGYVQLAVNDYVEATIIMLSGSSNNGNVVAHELFAPWYSSRLQVEWVSA